MACVIDIRNLICGSKLHVTSAVDLTASVSFQVLADLYEIIVVQYITICQAQLTDKRLLQNVLKEAQTKYVLVEEPVR